MTRKNSKKSLRLRVFEFTFTVLAMMGLIILLISADAFEQGYITASENTKHIVMGLLLNAPGALLLTLKCI